MSQKTYTTYTSSLHTFVFHGNKVSWYFYIIILWSLSTWNYELYRSFQNLLMCCLTVWNGWFEKSCISFFFFFAGGWWWWGRGLQCGGTQTALRTVSSSLECFYHCSLKIHTFMVFIVSVSRFPQLQWTPAWLRIKWAHGIFCHIQVMKEHSFFPAGHHTAYSISIAVARWIKLHK